MSKKKQQATDVSKLRQRAEDVLKTSSSDIGSPERLSSDDMKALIHDFQIHQIELEMQNDELERSQEKLERSKEELERSQEELERSQEELERSKEELILEIREKIKAQKSLDQAKDDLFQSNTNHELRVTKRKKDRESALSRMKDRKAALSRMAAQENMASIGQLTAGVAHELNNPINFLHTNFVALVDNFKDLHELLTLYRSLAERASNISELQPDTRIIKSAEQQMEIEFILEDIPSLLSESEDGFQRIAQIIKGMMNFSRATSEDEQTFACINKGIEDVLIIARSEYKNCAKINTDLGKIPEIKCYIGQLNQVFLNLVVNSAHAIASQNRQESGLITVRTRLEKETVLCEVKDNGPGITPEHITHIFEPFFTTKDPGKGTGLGLSIAYDTIINKHGGEFSVMCPVEGGTIFSIRLPLKTPDKK